MGAALGLTATAEATDYTVSNTNPTGSGSLAQAMIDQNNGTGPDRILFQSAVTGSINLTTDLTYVDEPLQILGPGANVLTINGNNAHRIFTVQGPGGDLTVSGLRMTNGNPGGTGVGAGGAILNGGTLTVQDSNITGNTGYGAGVYSGYGTLTVERSSVSANTGYGIRTRVNDTTIQDSTIADNTSIGLRVSHESPVIENSTISGNAGAGLGGFYGYFNLTSTVVSDSGGGYDLYSAFGGPATFNADFSLIENPGSISVGGTNNITGVDPALGSLGANGGPTPTKKPSNTSALLDKGSGGGTDQRGQPRPFDIASIPNAGNGADIGAVELQASDFPAPPGGSAQPVTGQRAAALKKCKKKAKKQHWSKTRLKKCKKKANQLPV